MLGFGHYEQGGTSSAIKARDHKDATDLVAFVKVVRSGARDKDGNLPAEVWREEQTNPTLTQFDQGDTRSTTAIVFHPHRSDGARIQGDTCHTLTAYMGTGGLNTPMVAQPIPMQDGTKFASQNGIGVGKEGDPMYTLDTISQNAVAQPDDTDLAVRRLTPLECERLMGWPDNHTLHRADGKQNSDSARYKMCGNGVVAPVSAWIAKHLAALLQK
jgi:DNA (cytosine-5)-methyltransferase 1